MDKETEYAHHSEMLRLALPLMARHRVPPTPSNYTVWYNYVSGNSQELRQRIEEIVAEGSGFNAAINQELYEEFGSDYDVERIETIRGDLHHLMQDVSTTLSDADQQTDEFGDNLSRFSSTISSDLALHDIQKLLEALVSETRHMHEITQMLQEHILAKTQEISNLQKELDQERTRSRTDMMTKLANRTAFYEALTQGIERQGDKRGGLCLMMLDIDHFKRINDNHGHLVGDRVIKFVAQTIRKSIKGRDVAARYGGEEFTLLMENTPKAGAKHVGHQIMAEISGAKLLRADTKQPIGMVTVSIGLAVYRNGEEMLAFIDRADQALYQAKQRGRNRLCTD